MSSDASSVIVFAGSGVEASMVLSFLKSNGIAARLEDEHIGTMVPHVAAGGGAGAVKVAVAAEDAGVAKKLLAKHRGGV
jgi:hypothetical protein